MINATPKQLRKAANIQEKIQSLQSELNSILGGSDETAAIQTPRKRRKVSAAGRARMRAAQSARWAKIKGIAPKKKGKMSAKGLANIRAAQKARRAKIKGTAPKRKFTAAGRARLAALAKARWAEAKKAGKSRL
ncbi:MAG: hypothetical protein ABSD29_14265 [Verrucomicrobiota bacterium]